MSALEYDVQLLLGEPAWLSLVRLTLLSIAAVFVMRIWERSLQLGLALEIQWARKLGVRTGGLKFVLWSIVVGYSIKPLFDASALIVLVLCLGLLSFLSFWGAREIQNIIAGLALALRAPFTLGDEIALGQHRGVVEYVGLTRLGLRASDGAHLEVPCHLLSANKLVLPPRDAHSLPVIIIVDGPDNLPGDVAAAVLRDHALLSPYTDPDAPVLATPAGEGRIRVELTPIHSDEAAMLEGDLRSRAKLL